MRLTSLFKPKAEIYPMTLKDVKDSIVRHLWSERQYFKQKNEGGLRHRFFHGVHALFVKDEAIQEELDRESYLRADAYRALELAGESYFEKTEDFTEFLDNHPGFVPSNTKGITSQEVVEYIQENEECLRNDQSLKLMY